MRQSLMQAVALGAALFLVLAGAGLTAALIHDRQTREREAAQESLRESEARFRDFAATASDWFWEQDETLRFVFSSSGAPDMAERIIGKTRRELVRRRRKFRPQRGATGRARGRSRARAVRSRTCVSNATTPMARSATSA